MIDAPAALYPNGFICTQESIQAVQRRPELEERAVLDAYRTRYREAMGRLPHGLHYIPFPDQPDTVAVWFAPED